MNHDKLCAPPAISTCPSLLNTLLDINHIHTFCNDDSEKNLDS